MTTELFAQVPTDLSDLVALKLFLQRTLEQIDSVSSTQINLTEEVATLAGQVVDLESTAETSSEAITELQNEVIFNGRTLDASFYDFDETVWGELRGYATFTALGSALTNPPVALTGGTTYIVHIESVTSANGDIMQRVLIEDTGTDLKVFFRTGATFALAITNGWTQV